MLHIILLAQKDGKERGIINTKHMNKMLKISYSLDAKEPNCAAAAPTCRGSITLPPHKLCPNTWNYRLQLQRRVASPLPLLPVINFLKWFIPHPTLSRAGFVGLSGCYGDTRWRDLELTIFLWVLSILQGSVNWGLFCAQSMFVRFFLNKWDQEN